MMGTILQVQRLARQINLTRNNKVTLNEPVAAYHILALLAQSVCYCCFKENNNIKLNQVSTVLFYCISGLLDIILCCLILNLINNSSIVVSVNGAKLDFAYMSDSSFSEVDDLITGEGDQDQQEWESDFTARRLSFERKMDQAILRQSFE